MLNLDFICQHPDVIRDALQKRCEAQIIDIDEVLGLVAQRRPLVTSKDNLYTSLKKLREQIRTVAPDSRAEFNEQIRVLSEKIRQLEVQVGDIEKRLQMQLLALPNIPHVTVKVGNEADPDEEIHRWGEPRAFHFDAQSHWDLGARLGIMDAEMGVRVAGSRFMLLKGAGARLERALISLMLDVHTCQHGYTEVMPPELVKGSVMFDAGQLPKFADQAYVCNDDLYLNPTAEVPLVGMHSNTTMLNEDLPLRYVAWTTAFRREAGSASRNTHGLMRLHQFNKVELFQFVEPEHSYSVLTQMLEHAEKILQLLELPYRVVALNSAHLPFSAAKTFDIEVWMPGMKEYIEVSSVSNCEAFQARRANIKYRSRRGKRGAYVHTLNGSGLAVGRTMAALLETYQQADGTVVVPEVLRPYMGTSLLGK